MADAPGIIIAGDELAIANENLVDAWHLPLRDKFGVMGLAASVRIEHEELMAILARSDAPRPAPDDDDRTTLGAVEWLVDRRLEERELARFGALVLSRIDRQPDAWGIDAERALQAFAHTAGVLVSIQPEEPCGDDCICARRYRDSWGQFTCNTIPPRVRAGMESAIRASQAGEAE